MQHCHEGPLFASVHAAICLSCLFDQTSGQHGTVHRSYQQDEKVVRGLARQQHLLELLRDAGSGATALLGISPLHSAVGTYL